MSYVWIEERPDFIVVHDGDEVEYYDSLEEALDEWGDILRMQQKAEHQDWLRKQNEGES